MKTILLFIFLISIVALAFLLLPWAMITMFEYVDWCEELVTKEREENET